MEFPAYELISSHSLAMDLGRPFQALFPTVDSAVLAVLAESTKPRTGRELARLAERSQGATQQVLNRLVIHGLVLQREAGRARVYELNREHLAARPIAELANLRSLLFSGLRQSVLFWLIPPVHVSVFGSTARGEGDIDSDVDIFLVRPGGVDEDDEKWRAQVDAFADEIFKMTGNHAGIAEVGEKELSRLRRDQPAILDSLRSDAIGIAGTPLPNLLRRT
ncbi:MAG TPA: nucleotidyltransferase domain-containing protein [Solirubrobacterales bacterium]|nr:nucleotidyltransferase domain-containing protein [Solirubrobacterales bacterium]